MTKEEFDWAMEAMDHIKDHVDELSDEARQELLSALDSFLGRLQDKGEFPPHPALEELLERR